MKSKSIYVLFALFFTITFSINAQTNEEKAFHKFKQAREAYQNNNFLEAAQLLIETKEFLGSTNVRIQPMLIKSLTKIEDWQLADKEIHEYYGLNPDKSLVEYQEIVEIDRQVDIKVKEDNALYESSKNSKSITQMESYLSKFPYGKYREEVKTLISTQKDENAWELARSKNNTSAYEVYVSGFPNGSYAQIAKEQINQWDDEAYQKAKADGTQHALTYYLNNYSRGKYRNEISDLLKERQEEDAYASTRSGNLVDYEYYIKKYPNGKYATQVNKAIEEYLFAQAEKSYSDGYYPAAVSIYADYINRYPEGENVEKAKSKQKKADRKSRQHSSSYFGFTYESQGALGIAIGGLNKDRLAFYFNLRATPEVFEAQWKEPELEIPEDIIPDDEKLAVASLSMGFSYPIMYPVWLYAGGGVNYQERYIEGDDENLYYKLEGEKTIAFYPEAGLNIRIGSGFTITGGAVYVREEVLYKVGLAFGL